jgi:hypothetical protein
MTPEQLQKMIEDGVAKVLAAQGASSIAVSVTEQVPAKPKNVLEAIQTTATVDELAFLREKFNNVQEFMNFMELFMFEVLTQDTGKAIFHSFLPKLKEQLCQK